MIELDTTDKQLLNVIQASFPLVPRPFAEIGPPLGIGEEEVIARLLRLKEAGILRQLSAIFDTRALGYQSTLVAMSIPPDRLRRGASVVNGHPGVSHNYRRNHSFNLWFTMALPPSSSLERTVARLHDLAGAESSRLLPTLRLFKIGVKFDMTGQEDLSGTQEPAKNGRTERRHDQAPLSPQEIAAVRELQSDLALVPAPFEAMAERLGIAEGELLAQAKAFLESGLMRRFAAVLHHRKVGFSANGMVVWKVPESRVEEVGTRIATFNAVSHCYQRPSYPDWPYSIFSMIHGRSREECESVADAISRETGITDRAVLYSTKEYKKVRVILFTPEFERWEEKYLR